MKFIQTFEMNKKNAYLVFIFFGIVFCLLFSITKISAQNTNNQVLNKDSLLQINQDTTLIKTEKPKYLRFLEIGVGATAYKGDLNSRYDYFASSLQIGIKFNKKKRLNSHLNLTLGTVIGQNYQYKFTDVNNMVTTPNQYFKTSIFSFQYDLQYNFIKKINFILYMSQGIGFLRFVPKDDEGKELQDQRNTRANDETYNNTTLTLPLSFGAMYILKNGYGFGVQASYLFPQTDYIDNISNWGQESGKDKISIVKFWLAVPLAKIKK